MKTLAADILSFLLALLTILLLGSTHSITGGAYVQVQCQEGVYRYNLNQDRTIKVPGPLGETTIRIENGEASIVDSPCQNKDCIRAHALSESNCGFIACLPNKVLLSLTSKTQREVDDVTE